MPSEVTPPAENQRRIDLLIIGFTVLVVCCMVGMLTNILFLAMVPLPILLALMMFMGALDLRGNWDQRKSITVLALFNAVSVGIWVAAWATADVHHITLGGFPVSTGLLMLVLWPIYIFGSGLVYAYWVRTSKDADVVVETTEKNGT